MTQIHPLAIVSSGRIWTVQQNGRTESTNTPNYALFRLRNLKGPIDEVALCNAILTPQDAREDFTFEVSDYDGTAATVRIVFNNTTHENLVQRLSIYPEIRSLSENGFYDWLAIDSATIQCMNPRPTTESTYSQDQPIQIETVDRAIDQISGGEYFNANLCLPSIFPGTTLTSSEDGRTSILWGESFTTITTTIKMVNLMIFTRARDFTETEKDRFLVFIVRILNVMKSIPILGKTVTAIEEHTGGRVGHDFFQGYYEELDQLLVKLEEALGETIISLSEGQYDNLNEHFRKMGEVLSRICPFVERGCQELNDLAEYVKKLQERKDITDKIVKGALTGAAISFTAGLTTLVLRKILMTCAIGAFGCAGGVYLLSNKYKNNISRYNDTHKNFRSMESLLKRMSESNDNYLNLDEGRYPGRAEILIECLKEFQEEVCKLRPSTTSDAHTL